jgi:apolipoprotein N-acyltransferase
MQSINQLRVANKLTSLTNIDGRDIRDICLSSALFIFSYAPSPFGFLIYVAFIPQLFLYQRNKPVRSAVYGYLIGLIVNACILYWLMLYAGSGFSIIVILNALQFAIFGGLLSTVFHSHKKMYLIVFPFLWTFLDYIRQLGDLAFSWLNVAFTQTYFIYLIQFLDLTGQSGIVFWICLINISIYLIISSRGKLTTSIKYSVLLLLMFILPFFYGAYRLSEQPIRNGISIAYLQPNIDLAKKWNKTSQHENLQSLITLTDSILISDPDLVIWPETAIPYYLGDHVADLTSLQSHIEFYNYHLLTGAIDYSIQNGKKKKHNAAYFFEPRDSSYKIYRKLLLVPGEETYPLYEYLPGWISRFENEPLEPGTEPVVFRMKLIPYLLEYKEGDWQITGRSYDEKLIRIACVICYEAVFPNIVQRFYNSECDLLIIITNDAWFDFTSQPFQHLQVAVFRAIEQRTSVVRCANTGVSTFIDPYGRKYLESSLFSTTAAQKVMPVDNQETFYSRYGDIVGIISGIFVFSFLFLQVLSMKWKILPNSYRTK